MTSDSTNPVPSTTIPTFKTNRLILRGVEKKDIPAYQKYFADYEVIQYLASTVPWPYPENGVENFLEQFIFPHQGKDIWMWGLFEKKNPDELIGAIHLWRQGKPEHRGFWLGKAFWGQGYMTEAVEPITNYAFEKLGFEKLVFNNAVGNERSARIKEKSGAKLIGIAPAKFVDPKYTEHEIWELDKPTWLANRRNQVQKNIANDKNPLEGITLETVVTELVENYGWQRLSEKVKIACFTDNPSIKSSLVFLRKTAWARTKVEQLYVWRAKTGWDPRDHVK